MRWILITVTVAISLSSPSFSKEQGHKNASNSEQTASTEKRGTDDQPIAVKIVTSNEAEKKAAREEEREVEKASQDRTITIATVLLAIVTAVLAVVTGGLWFSTYRLGDDAKKSGERQNAALQNIERAYLFVEVAADEDIQSSQTPVANAIRVRIWNYGKTPAEIVQIRAYPTIEQATPDKLLDHPGSEIVLPPGLGLAQNHSFDVATSIGVSNMDLSDIQNSYRTLYCVGRIRYRDIFNIERETGFCWFYSHHMRESKFIIAPNSDLNKRT